VLLRLLFCEAEILILKTCWGWLCRGLAYLLLFAGFGFAAVVLALRYWLLPDIEQYRPDIANALTQAAGQRVRVGRIAADWHGLRPNLTLLDVQVYDRNNRPALILGHVEGTLSWWTLLQGEIRLYSLMVDRPSLAVRREADGVIYIGGIPVNQAQRETGFADWVLKQRWIIVQDATILWQDDMRQAPPLVLSKVSLRLENRGRHHDFGLRATPPPDLAEPLDVRGALQGETINDPAGWHGQLYARMDRTDMAAWRNWARLPFELQSGYGGVRLWVDFARKRVTGVTADLLLDDVKARLAPDLPQLDLVTLGGRLGWREQAGGQEFRGRKLALAAQDGTAVTPTDVLVRLQPAQGKRPATGLIEVDSVNLESLGTLAAYLPFPGESRRRLAEAAPRGNLSEVAVKWSGDWDAPQQYALKGRFAELGMKPYGAIPGFAGVSGNLDANQQGGSLSLQAPNAVLEFPKVFRDPMPLDTLTAQLRWKAKQGGIEVNFSNVSYANADLAGTLYGSYRSVPGTPGILDLTGNLTRADGSRAVRYLPLILGKDALSWLDVAFLAGHSNDVRVRVKGNLADFPFIDGKPGVFQVTARVNGAVLHYAEGWPNIENITADLLFKGDRMEINARQGSILGARLGRVRAVIPNLLVRDQRLDIDGEAQGPTGEFFRFIGQSPVNAMIGGFTEDMQAAGNGRLNLKLAIPLRQAVDSKVAGVFQFTNNRLVADPDLPALEQVNGRLEFSETGVRAQNISGQFLGGPLSLSAVTQKDGTVRVTAAGGVSGGGLRKAFDNVLTRSLQGATDWHGVITLRHKLADFAIESSLRGMASDLPAPLAKKANEALPLRIERKVSQSAAGVQQESVSMSCQIFSALLVRSGDGRQSRLDRAAISFGGKPELPAESGIWLGGTLRHVDLDQWRSLLDQGGGSASLPNAGVDLSFGSVDAFGKRFNALHVAASMHDGTWQAALRGKEVNGDVAWKPADERGGQDRGKVTGRFKSLTLPESAPLRPGVGVPDQNLPALDVIAENFQIKQNRLGRLELLAAQQGRDWRIEKLHLQNPESVLQMDGVWRLPAGAAQPADQPLTKVNLKLEVNDIGKFLARLNYPDNVKRGKAKLEGQLSWAGSPAELDYASLSGNLALEAHNGQFTKVEPGIGKLLGILSLQALPRRITLDFRDVFSEGFAFDDISGSMRIVRGVVSSDDFTMQGSAARVSMSGEADLTRETQKLRVRITPSFGDSVSVAGAFLGGPVVGLTALLVQKALKDPLGRMAAYEYQISGTWSEPKVSKIQAQPAASE
jgi:uncharacterized protein (TIGR02099 family)